MIAVAAGLVLPAVLQARMQEPDWPRHELPPLMEESREIAIALSAAPPHISESAAVWVLRRGGFHKVREGANGFTCMVDRYWAQAIEPICFNPEAPPTSICWISNKPCSTNTAKNCRHPCVAINASRV